jgi:glycerol uptake facilitator-like aquaporin
MKNNCPRVFAEFLGTAILLAAIVGSGIMAERLSGGNAALALLCNALATAFTLYFLIEIFGETSGAHFNPAVSIVMTLKKDLPPSLCLAYLVAQISGAVLGVWLANAMFDLSLLQFSDKLRIGANLWLAECVATTGLLLVVLRAPKTAVAACVAAYIGAAYWFTSSTSFANPAVTIGRMFSDTFAGISPRSVPAFILSQIVAIPLAFVIDRLPGEKFVLKENES